MTDALVVTRFAPSPTGELHLGNARTALFSFLLARSQQGQFILRVEDTDKARSTAAHMDQLLDDLRWLGLQWDVGPYLQSERGEFYERMFAQLHESGQVYPCFCSALELELQRKTQLAAGQPPRYAGTCRELSTTQHAAKLAQGLLPTLRFKVPAAQVVEFGDLVHGEQRFNSSDIGDFIVRRADGSPAFFFCNAVDDADMGVTHVLRGEDHLTNTPRQLLLLKALGLKAPQYAHVSLLVGGDGAPLSKRHGATSVRAFRELGYLSLALNNQLFRLGHSSEATDYLSLEQMAAHFDTQHLGRAPARFDLQQLAHWQKSGLMPLTVVQVAEWIGPDLLARIPSARRSEYLEIIKPNLLLPQDAQYWVSIFFDTQLDFDAASEQILRNAGSAFFQAATAAVGAETADFSVISAAVRSATGKTGAELFKPLRLALTGRLDGPQLAPLLKVLPLEIVRARLARYH
jgi:nondiscriminating glutamyl-tRNA synthetase